MELEQGTVRANDVDFAFLSCGEGPLALCLHGFPDSAFTYRHLLPELAAHGFRAVAPWMRGYAPTSVAPDGRYHSGLLAMDACALHDALGGGADAVVIGHDWGARAADGAAGLEPERWRRIVTLALPPLPALAAGMLSYDQLRRSWYMYFFLHPFADFAVPLDDLAFIERLWADWSPGYAAEEDVAHTKDALREPANLAAALGYYRAALGLVEAGSDLAAAEQAVNGVPPQPHLYLHGTDDGCLGIELGRAAEGILPAGSQVAFIEGAGHFLHLEDPAKVNALIVDFLTR